MPNTSRMGLPYPLGSDAPNTNQAYQDLAQAVDSNAAMFGQGTLAARPTSTPGSPGKQGRLYMVTSGAEIGAMYYDMGTGWIHINPASNSNLIGTLANRPAANTVLTGTKYFATDQVMEYISDGANWIRTGDPAGKTAPWFKPDSAAPAGYVKYDGTNLPSSSGIYADLYAHLGTLTTPNTKGRTIVGHDPTDADWDGIGELRGAKNVAHSHPFSAGFSTGGPSGQVYDSYADAPGNPKYANAIDHTHSGSVSGTTGAASDSYNVQPSIVAVYIAKL